MCLCTVKCMCCRAFCWCKQVHLPWRANQFTSYLLVYDWYLFSVSRCKRYTMKFLWLGLCLFSDSPNDYYYRMAKVGHTVKFRCPTNMSDHVDWVRLDTLESCGKYINRSRFDQRFTVDKDHSHTLVIHNVTVNDSAYYRCVEDGGFGNRHFYGLTVQGDCSVFLSVYDC